MARKTNKEGREAGGEGGGSEVKKGFPYSYGIYLLVHRLVLLEEAQIVTPFVS